MHTASKCNWTPEQASHCCRTICFRKMSVRCCPQPSSHRFQSYTGHPIRVEGSVILPTKYKSTTLDVKYYIVNTQQKPLLSGDDSRRLGLIDRINTVKDMNEFPMLQKTTTTLPGTYSLKVDPTVTPVVHGPILMIGLHGTRFTSAYLLIYGTTI